MDDRLVVALILVAALLAVMGWLAFAYMQKRQEFKRRQLGRGKNIGEIPIK